MMMIEATFVSSLSAAAAAAAVLHKQAFIIF